jgi:hypothetical protein
LQRQQLGLTGSSEFFLLVKFRQKKSTHIYFSSFSFLLKEINPKEKKKKTKFNYFA